MTNFIRRQAQRKKWALIAVATAQHNRCKRCFKSGHRSRECKNRRKSRHLFTSTFTNRVIPSMVFSKNSDPAPEYSDSGSSSDEVLIEQASSDSSDAESSADRAKQKVDELLKYVVKKELHVIVTDTIEVEDDSCKFLVVEMVLSRPGPSKKRNAAEGSDAKRRVPNKKKRQPRSKSPKKEFSSSSNPNDTDSDTNSGSESDADVESGSN